MQLLNRPFHSRAQKTQTETLEKTAWASCFFGCFHRSLCFSPFVGWGLGLCFSSSVVQNKSPLSTFPAPHHLLFVSVAFFRCFWLVFFPFCLLACLFVCLFVVVLFVVFCCCCCTTKSKKDWGKQRERFFGQSLASLTLFSNLPLLACLLSLPHHPSRFLLLFLLFHHRPIQQPSIRLCPQIGLFLLQRAWCCCCCCC